MKSLEILLRLIDNLLTAIKFRKAQNERTELEANPDNWFALHFGNGVQSKNDKANKADSGDNA